MDNNTGLKVSNIESIIKIWGPLTPIALDIKNMHIYWGNNRYTTINRTDIVSQESSTLFKYAIGFVNGIAADWTSNILYWSDSLMNMIELSTTDGKYRKVLFRFDQGDTVQALTADPRNGYVISNIFFRMAVCKFRRKLSFMKITVLCIILFAFC